MADDITASISGTVTDDDDSRDSGVKSKVRKAGKRASESGQRQLEQVASEARSKSAEPSPNSSPRYVDVDSYRKGGKVRKTGPAKLHRGERVMKRGGKRKAGRAAGRY